MNTTTVTQSIRDKLKLHNFNIVIEGEDNPLTISNSLPLARIKEINSSMQKIESNSYQTLSYELTLLDKNTTNGEENAGENAEGNQDKERLKSILFEVLKHILQNKITTQVDLKSLTLDRAKYTVHNEVSLNAKFKVTTIYDLT